nr:hypothetical protein [Tanacetum cinerariifolium]GEY66275.1 hypothetical protein [Tanacetum cinerariifolium]
MGYSFYSPSENKVFVAQNAEFFESKFLDLKESGSVEDLELIQEEDTNPSVDTSLNHEEDDQELNEPQSDINPFVGDLGEPANYKVALLDLESKKWLNAMNVERQSMKDNDVWVLVELPPNARIVGSKWLFKKKTDMDGAVYVYKARLVAKGFTQTYRVDYEEIISPVADIRAIRILIAIAVYYDYEIWQMDVKTAFLNGHLFEEVYMEQPNGNNIPMLQDVKSYLGRSFAMKDLGDAAYILGIKIYRDRSKRLISLCQSSYIEKILKRYYMENSKRGMIPMQEKLKFSKSQGASTPVEKLRIPYASAIGSIMYAVRCTRPDVAFTQNMASRFQQNPSEEHWTAVKNILKYLRNTKDMFLVYGSNMERELKVSCYTDAGYLTDADILKSQTRYVFVLNGGVVDEKSTKQSIFATSSTDADSNEGDCTIFKTEIRHGDTLYLHISPIRINIIFLSTSENISMKVKETDTIDYVKAKIQLKKGVPIDKQRVHSCILQMHLWGATTFDGNRTLNDCEIKNGDTLCCDFEVKGKSIKTMDISSVSSEMVMISAVMLNGRTVNMEVNTSVTMSRIKSVIEAKEGLPPNQCLSTEDLSKPTPSSSRLTSADVD